jgi:hypothetical protein
MKRFFITIVSLILVSVVLVGCVQDLPDVEKEQFNSLGFMEGYTCGYWAAAETSEIWWISPDRVEEIAKNNPKILDGYIPMGYFTMEDVSNAHFPDGTPYNEKQKKTAIKEYNWGFYEGFHKGCMDYLVRIPQLAF